MRSFLAEQPLFRDVPEKCIADSLESGKLCERSFRAGELILSPDSEIHGIWILLSGKASVTTPDAAKRQLLRYLRKGDLFGVTTLFSTRPFISVIRSEEDCRILSIPEETILDWMDRFPAFRLRFLAFLQDRIVFLNRKICYLTAGSAERKLALYLSSFGTDRIVIGDSLTSLSELLDLGRASLYRAFDTLTADGFLLRDGKELILPDRAEMLRHYGGNTDEDP